MPQIVCRICLRSDFDKTGTIDEKLTLFYGELCDFGLKQSAARFCLLCEHRLKKFYNFRQQCRRANELIKSCGQKKNLQELLSPPSLGFVTHSDRQAVYHYFYLDSRTMIQFDNEKLYKDEYMNDNPSDASINLDHVYEASTIDIRLPKKQEIKWESDSIEEDQNYQEIDSNENVLLYNRKQEHDLQDTDLQEHDLQDTGLQEHDLQDTGLQEHDLQDTDLQEHDLQDTDITDSDLQVHYLQNNYIKNNDSSSDDNTWDPVFPDSDLDEDKQINQEQGTKRKFGTEIDVSCQQDFNLLDENDQEMIVIQGRLLALKLRILQLLDLGEFQDLGHPMNKEIFLKMFEKVDKTCLSTNASSELPRLRKYLQILIKRFDPKYETVFNIQYLTTFDEKLAEFHHRRLSKAYLGSEFKCQHCFKVFENKKYLDYHNNWHDPSRQHACAICAMRFTSYSNLRDHEQRDHYSVYRCKQCPLVTYNFDAMLNHYHMHEGMKYSCDLCPTVTSSRSSLNGHRVQAHATLTCAICKRRFVSQPGLNAHTKIKHGVSALVRLLCEECDETFVSANALQEHVLKEHPNGPVEKFHCRFPNCGLKFPSIEELKVHKALMKHTSTRRSWQRAHSKLVGHRICPVCGEQVPNTSALALYRHHMTNHAGVHYEVAKIGKFLCEQCGKDFKMKASYLEHLNSHSGAKPYTCKQCPARFARHSRLVTHMERHGPKKYRCEQCGKMYPTNANLWQHAQTHTGIRRFKCDLCDATFVHSAGLSEHVRGVHLHIRRVKNKTVKKEKKE